MTGARDRCLCSEQFSLLTTIAYSKMESQSIKRSIGFLLYFYTFS